MNQRCLSQVLAVLAVDEDGGLNGRVVYELVPNASAAQHFYLQNKGTKINLLYRLVIQSDPLNST